MFFKDYIFTSEHLDANKGCLPGKSSIYLIRCSQSVHTSPLRSNYKILWFTHLLKTKRVQIHNDNAVQAQTGQQARCRNKGKVFFVRFCFYKPHIFVVDLFIVCNFIF